MESGHFRWTCWRGQCWSKLHLVMVLVKKEERYGLAGRNGEGVGGKFVVYGRGY